MKIYVCNWINEILKVLLVRGYKIQTCSNSSIVQYPLSVKKKKILLIGNVLRFKIVSSSINLINQDILNLDYSINNL